MMDSPDQIGAWVAAALLGGAAAFERLNNIRVRKKHEQNAEAISDARMHQERANTMTKLFEDLQKRYDVEEEKHWKYRDWAHEKFEKDQVTMLKSQDKIEELQMRPDFTDLFKHMSDQADVSIKILTAIEGMVGMMRELLSRRSINES